MTQQPGNGTCTATTADGSPCRGRVARDSKCIFHLDDEASKRKRVEAARLAGTASGAARRRKAERARELEPVPLESVEDALGLLARTINEVRAKQLDTAAARIQLQCVRTYLEFITGREVEGRIRDLEELVRDHELQNPVAWAAVLEAKANAWREVP